VALLEPIYEAQFESIRASRVKAMDETPIKAGRSEPGKLKAAYFWPVYGMEDEVCFPFFESRRAEHVEQALGLTHAEGAVLLSDGYAAYVRYADKAGITHASAGRTHGASSLRRKAPNRRLRHKHSTLSAGCMQWKNESANSA